MLSFNQIFLQKKVMLSFIALVCAAYQPTGNGTLIASTLLILIYILAHLVSRRVNELNN